MLWSRLLNGSWRPRTRANWIRGEASFPLETQRSDVKLGDATATGNGTVYPRPLTSVQGNALRMDGPQDVMKLDPAVSNGVLYPITLTCWAYISVDRNNYSTIFAVEDGAGHSVKYNELITDTDGTTLSVYDDVTGDIANVVSMATGTWYAIAFKITNGAWKSYHGTEGFTALTTQTGALTNIAFNDLTGIGSTTFTATETWNGRFAMYRVWNADLTDAEIAAELRSSERIVSAGLLSSVFPQGVSAGNELTAQHGTDVLSRGVGTPDWTFEAGPKLTVASVGSVSLSNSTSAMTGQVGADSVTGTSSVTLSNSTATGVGQLVPVGTSAVTLSASTATGTGQLVPVGTSAVTLDATSATSTGAHGVAGTSAVTIGDTTATGAGQLVPVGTSAVTLSITTATADGAHGVAAVSSISLSATSSNMSGTVDSGSITSTSAIQLGLSTSSGSAGVGATALSSVQLGATSSAISAQLGELLDPRYVTAGALVTVSIASPNNSASPEQIVALPRSLAGANAVTVRQDKISVSIDPRLS